MCEQDLYDEISLPSLGYIIWQGGKNFANVIKIPNLLTLVHQIVLYLGGPGLSGEPLSRDNAIEILSCWPSKNKLSCCGEGHMVGNSGQPLGAEHVSPTAAGNLSQ